MQLSKQILDKLQKLAEISGKKGNLPTASVIFDADQNIVGSSQSYVITYSDPTAHSELLTIQKVTRDLEKLSLTGYSLVTVLEPSVMSIAAAHWAELGNIYYLVSAADYVETSPWFTEVDVAKKQELIRQMQGKPNLEHLAEYREQFAGMFEKYKI